VSEVIDHKEVILHIGMHKTASTWLQSYYFNMFEGAELIPNKMPPWKTECLKYLIKTRELDYDPAVTLRFIDNEFHEKNKIILSSERLSGHPASGIEEGIQLCRKLYKTFPHAKVVVVIRNQVDIIDSIYRQLVREGIKDSVENFLDNDWWKTSYFDLQNYKYSSLILAYYKRFGEENVKVMFYEDFRKNKGEFVNELNDFFGVNINISKTKSNKVRNARLNYISLIMVRYLNYLRKTEFNRGGLCGVSMNMNSLVEYLSYLFRFIKDRPVFTDKKIEFLRDYYLEDNSKLSELLGVKLPNGWQVK
jgi:hypothetical protein